MKRHSIVAVLASVLVIAGIAVGGYSIIQIRQMNSNSGSQVLPELAHFSPHTSPYAKYASVEIRTGDYLGSISIPALKESLPMYEGTADAQLKMGVGHFAGSVLPGLKDNSVLAGKFTYKISSFRIVMADDRTVIVPTKNAVLTLSTCYPFRYFGNAPKRYIVSANLFA